MPQSDDRAALLALLKSKSVFHGDFTLASGAKSKYYIDCRLTTLDPRGAWLVGSVMLKLIRDEAARRNATVNAIGGLTMGADPISLSVAMQSHAADPNNPIRCFVVRKTAKAHGQGKLVEGNFQKGDQVVVIDDVVTKGDSTITAIESIQKEGGKVLFAAVLVDRQEGGRAKIEGMGFPVIAAFTKEDLLT